MKTSLRYLLAIPGIPLILIGYTVGVIAYFIVPGFRAACADLTRLGEDDQEGSL